MAETRAKPKRPNRAEQLKAIGDLVAVRAFRMGDGTEYSAGDAIQAKHRGAAMLLGGYWVRPASATQSAPDKCAVTKRTKAAVSSDVAESAEE